MFSTIATVLGSALAEVLIELGIKKVAGKFIPNRIKKNKAKLAKYLTQGNLKEIQWALLKAREDVLSQFIKDEERTNTILLLDAVLKSKSSPQLEEFGKQITQTYLLGNSTNSSTAAIIKTFLQVIEPTNLIKSVKLDEIEIIKLIQCYFLAFRERLLQIPEFVFLREYLHLTESRKQTILQQTMLEKLDKISSSKPDSIEDLNIDIVSKEYCNYLINELQFHVIRGFAPQVGCRIISLQLSKIFLPLKAIEGRPTLTEYAEEDLRIQAASDAMVELDFQQRKEEMEKRYEELSKEKASQRSQKLADLLKNHRLVILGDPGSGKTTITRYITYALAAKDPTHIGRSAISLVPVLIRLATFGKALDNNNNLHLIDYIEKKLTPRIEFGRYLRQAIESGQCLIILDGLDEVADPGLRMQVTDQIHSLVSCFNKNRFLVTSRIIGYEQSPLTREFKHSTIMELKQEDQKRFIRLWYGAIKSEISESTHGEGAEALIQALHEKPQIERMAANPLLLTIMVLMHWRGVKLPSRRVQVYQIDTDTLIEYWTAQRGITNLDAEEIKDILAPIAHYILSSSVSGVISLSDLMPRFCNGIVEQRGCIQTEAKRIARDLLRTLGEHSGIFLERGLDANGQPVYGFLHQTFGEYLAALHLAEMLLAGKFDLKSYIHRSVWYEPLLLLVSHLSIISQTHTNLLMREILGFSDPYEDILQRSVLLASDCLADDIQVKPHLRDEILEKLANLLQHSAPQVRDAAVLHYERLAKTRHCEAAAIALEKTLNTDFHSMFNHHKVTLIKESIQFPPICYSTRAHE